MKKVKAYFKNNDPVLYSVISGTEWSTLKRDHDHFTGLCRIIIGQQVSTKAAHAIFSRYIALFPKNLPSYQKVLKLTENELRSVGLSRSKTLSIRDLAERIHAQVLNLTNIEQLEDDEVKEMLIAVRGIGPWSAEMFLIFYLGREDIFSPGDLGLRTAIQKLYKKRELPSPEAAARFALHWSPYRSYACRILWQSLNNEPTQ